jgi:hypothetical protein
MTELVGALRRRLGSVVVHAHRQRPAVAVLADAAPTLAGRAVGRAIDTREPNSAFLGAGALLARLLRPGHTTVRRAELVVPETRVRSARHRRISEVARHRAHLRIPDRGSARILQHSAHAETGARARLARGRTVGTASAASTGEPDTTLAVLRARRAKRALSSSDAADAPAEVDDDARAAGPASALRCEATRVARRRRLARSCGRLAAVRRTWRSGGWRGRARRRIRRARRVGGARGRVAFDVIRRVAGGASGARRDDRCEQTNDDDATGTRL